MQALKTFLLVGTVALIAACSGPAFKGDVTRFHASLPPANGALVNIVAKDVELNGSLEFATYAEMLGGQLSHYGYAAADGEAPELIAVMEYAISEGREKLTSYPRVNIGFGHYGGRRYGHHSSYWWAYDPFLYDRGDNVRATTVYTATLKVSLRYPDGEDGNLGDVLFEGVVESESRQKHLPKLMPYMLEALFEGFPGRNGETMKIVIEPPEEE